jgi:(2R)-ethylmalonyl-CoA mutase
MSPDKPWIFRTYAGYATPRATNERFKANLAKGQTGLSVAFDLPTQCGYDSDHPMAAGEVGRVGVPVCHLGDMSTLLEGIPLQEMNTSMTINATAVWLLSLYVAAAEEHGVEPISLAGTTQNDILKEYLSRGTYAFPPEPSMRLTTDLITWTFSEVPLWNPINVCSYHLQEAGADPVLEVAFTLANAVAVLDAVQETGRVRDDDFPRLVGRISFFCNAGIRFVEEMCKVRAFTRLWDRLTYERYGVSDPKYRRFRYGVQVNSLGLTALQPECSFRRGTRRSGFHERGTSSGRFELSRSWRMRPISSSTTTSSKARRSLPRRRPRSSRRRGTSWHGCWSSAAPSTRSGT